jgi:hypothetical protein
MAGLIARKRIVFSHRFSRNINAATMLGCYFGLAYLPSMLPKRNRKMLIMAQETMQLVLVQVWIRW